jgi:hypothetical protein
MNMLLATVLNALLSFELKSTGLINNIAKNNKILFIKFIVIVGSN